MSVTKWVGVGFAWYLLISLCISAYRRAIDINNNKNTKTSDYFNGLLWPLAVVYIPYGLVEGTALLFAKYLGYRDKKIHAKKFGNVA
jgi:hypothetical protein